MFSCLKLKRHFEIISGAEGFPRVGPGADLSADDLRGRSDLRDGDVVVVTQKIVSKAEETGSVAVLTHNDPIAKRKLAESEARCGCFAGVERW